MTEIVVRSGRSVVNVHSTLFQAYDLEGADPARDGVATGDRATGQGCYLMRMEPGAVTVAHDHAGMEEFLFFEGELVNDDGSGVRCGRLRQLRSRHASQLAHRLRLHDRRLRMAPTERLGARA